MKTIRILFSNDAAVVYEYISKMSLNSKEEKIMFRAINRKLNLLKSNCFIGQPIAKRLIPKEYLLKYEINNLYRLELPFFWRLLYTIKDNKVEIIAFVLDIVNHKDYNKKFNY